MSQNKALHISVGQQGEKLASEYLKKKGYTILEQNYRTRYAEIDIVAKHKKTLVIVEVRTKVGETFGSPEDTLDQRKLWRVKRNAEWYASYKKWTGPYRVDAVCIVLDKKYAVERVEHYESIVGS